MTIPRASGTKLRVLVTGGTGFVGSCLLQKLQNTENFHPVHLARRHSGVPLPSCETWTVPDLFTTSSCEKAFHGIDAVIHCAGLAHCRADRDAFWHANVELTECLARQSARQGVRHFILLSSIAVYGSHAGKSLHPDQEATPESDYGLSKLVAEQRLRDIAAASGMDFTIIRPPLIYGPNAPGNFASLLKIVRRGIPLPFAGVRNKRSLLGIENLCDLLLRCLTHPGARNSTFLASDNDDLSTPELVRHIASGLQVRDPLFFCPESLLRTASHVPGLRKLHERLCQSLQLDISGTCHRLDWQPPLTARDGLIRAVL